jgi:hypothetical protein
MMCKSFMWVRHRSSPLAGEVRWGENAKEWPPAIRLFHAALPHPYPLPQGEGNSFRSFVKCRAPIEATYDRHGV